MDIKALAAELKIPYHSLRRDFKKMTGFAPTEYWIELKVREARQRLASTDESVGRIGERVGFEDAYYFSRVFKKRTGMSPMEYRIFFRGKN
ncbi:MAG: helix-turn-helix transcriptional regulator [Spirochaetia bacterium]|nr:helix-turn-helix transcriptional regulator [Spirochaetia bacterium]